MCAVAFAVPADISSAEDDTKYVSSFSLEPKTDDYAKVSGTLDYVLKYSLVGSSATAKATLLDSDGNSVGTATMSSSTLNSYSPSTNVNVTLPSTAGYYTLKVTVTEGEATYERFAEVKAVDPVKMSVTLENKGEVARTFKAAFYFQEGEGWVVVDGSEQSVTVEAKSTKDVEITSIGEDEEINLKFIVPERAINDLYKILEDDEKKKADIYISKKNMVVNVGNYIFFTKLIEGDYIPYENIINMKHKLHLKVNKDEFLAALERASLITDEKSSNRKKEYIKLEISSDRMILKAESSAGATYDEINVEYKGDPIIIGFSNRFMIENTRAIDCDEICIDMSSAFTATNMYAADPEEDSDQYMILPVKVN